MGKYDKSEIMKTAHRTYKYVGKKQGKSFGEVLKSTWKLAKLHVAMEESARKAKAEAEAKAEEMRIARMNTKSVRADYQGEISHEALYGHSFRSGAYVGD